MARRKSRISSELLDELLAGEDPREAFQSGELFAELQRSVAERALQAEMEVHLSSAEEVGSGNHRNSDAQAAPELDAWVGALEELYGVTVSRELISKVTDEIHEELREWRSRPLEAVYPLVYFDALRVKIREEGWFRTRRFTWRSGLRRWGGRRFWGCGRRRTRGRSSGWG